MTCKIPQLALASLSVLMLAAPAWYATAIETSAPPFFSRQIHLPWSSIYASLGPPCSPISLSPSLPWVGKWNFSFHDWVEAPHRRCWGGQKDPETH